MNLLRRHGIGNWLMAEHLTSKQEDKPPGFKFALFGTLRNKLIVLMMGLSLLPLGGMAIFSYFMARRQIEERINLWLGRMAQDTADKVDLMLRAKKEEIHSMATTYPRINHSPSNKNRSGLISLLNNYWLNHDGYDVLAVLDKSGKFLGITTMDPNGAPLGQERLAKVLGGNIAAFPEEKKLFEESLSGRNSHHDWYQSKLVAGLYDYSKEDRSHQYNVALSEPISDPVTHEIIGVWISIINWSHIQNILDNVEIDLAGQNLKSGYSFMLAKDADTLICHRQRSNRRVASSLMPYPRMDFYNTKLVKDHGLASLRNAILNRQAHFAYDWPQGRGKITGLARIDDASFGWIIGVEVDKAEIFRPIRVLTYWLLAVTALLTFVVVLVTYFIAEGIATPIRSLIHSASTIARGNFNQRVPVRSSDEVGILARRFNEMAGAISAREQQLRELNRNLESMVRERTIELENSHEALKRAYLELQNAQEQLIQTEKMASLGQLVAGIAHEIKNPLNFIYGNTGFLADYTQKLQSLVESFEKLPSISAEDRETMAKLKEQVHYPFIKEDLKILIDNFTEGAHRINAIVSDLRTFTRMDTDTVTDVDLHASLEMSLNLMGNQYKDRIQIHKEYGDIPRVRGYAGKLNQVFMNLLSNAFHAVPGKGDVWIRTRSTGDAVEIEIEDNGVGIPQENLRRIFEPFFTTKPVGHGTGLGLSISYGIIEQHRGKIFVRSSVHQGTCFTIRLPISEEKAE